MKFYQYLTYIVFLIIPLFALQTDKRIYYILKADQGAHRGKHAHKKLNQVLFCIQGSITMVLDNGEKREETILDQPNRGIFIDKMVWREKKEISKQY